MDPKVEIEYDRYSKTFAPGELVEGRVIIISSDSDTVLNNITVRVEGKRAAMVKPGKPEEFFFLESDFTMLSTELPLPDCEPIEYPFEFRLPSKLPSTFKVSRASVEYAIILQLRRKYDFDLTLKSNFIVTGSLEIDSYEEFDVRQSKPTGLCSCINWRKSPRFGYSGKISNSHFLPGEQIHFEIVIWNSSSAILQDCTISLIREFIVQDAGNFRTVLKEFGRLAVIQGPVVMPTWKVKWSSREKDTPIKIPEDLPPTNLGCKEFIDLNYFLLIKISTSGIFPSTLKYKYPIVIGTMRT